MFFTVERLALGIFPEAEFYAMGDAGLFFPAANRRAFGFFFFVIPHAVFFQQRLASCDVGARFGNRLAAPRAIVMFFTLVRFALSIVPKAELNAVIDAGLLFPTAFG